MSKIKKITFNNRHYIVTMRGEITISRKTKRKKYKKCLLCPETRYATRHHIEPKITIPLCPMCHHAVHIGDIKIRLME